MKPELLAPVGDPERLEAALRFGADAVYLGGPLLQLRSDTVGFSMEALQQAVKTVHARNKKIYVTVNSFTNDDEIDAVRDYARALYEMGVDALIVSDIGTIATIRESVPEIDIHLSTQANCMNAAAAGVYYRMGVKRIVLAREMSLEQIRVFRQKVPADMEIEAFVHGAMCMAYSGRCFISAYMAGRSGNRGECTQPCRWRYHLVEQKRPNEFFPVEEDEKGTTLLSSRDLRCVEFLDELSSAGVCSFKIEGRMKSPYYVATVVNAYRHAIDKTAPMEALLHELDCISHRPYSSGFYFGQMRRYVPDDDMAYHQDKVFAGVVKAVEGTRITVEQRNRFCVGDVLEIVSPQTIGNAFAVQNMRDDEGQAIEAAPHPMQLVSIDCPFPVSPGDILRKR